MLGRDRQTDRQTNKEYSGHLLTREPTYRWKSHFEKGYTKRWTNELFKIVDVIDTVPWTYEVYDLEGEDILGSFSSQKLQKTKIN